MGRIVLHLDMDAFFAAVEERDSRGLKGLPVVVGADPKGGKGRGVVSTANYKAREYGIHSAMAISRAWQLAQEARRQDKPEVVFLRPDFRRYEETAKRIREIIKNYATKLEQASIDEFYLELAAKSRKLKAKGDYNEAEKIAKQIKQEILEKEKLTCSVGIGQNKLIAKIASGTSKPNGLTTVTPEQVKEFLAPLPVRLIPGIGPKTEAVLLGKGVKTIQDLRRLRVEELQTLLGKFGFDLYQKARGIDEAPVTEEHLVKSIGEQETFLEDTRDPEFVFSRLEALCKSVIFRFLQLGFKSFKTIVLTVRFYDFETKSRSRTLSKPINSTRALEFEAMKLLTPFLDKRENPRQKLLRLIGVRIEKLE